MEPPKLNSGLDALEPEECFRLLATETVGRLGVVVDGRTGDLPGQLRARRRPHRHPHRSRALS